MTEFAPRVDVQADVVVVTAAGREVGFAPKALSALKLLLSGRPMAIDKVAATTGVDATELAQVLVAEGICAEVTPELASGYADLLMPESEGL